MLHIVKLATSLLLLACTTANLPAATYYLSNTGSDAAAGTAPTSAWATVGRLNQTALHPGDTVLFACGSLWRETLSFHTSGTAAAPITYASYGTCTPATKPVFSGSDPVTGWTAEPQLGVFSAPLAAPPTRVFAGGLHLLPSPTPSSLPPGSFVYDTAGHRLVVRLRSGTAPSATDPVEVAVRSSAGVGSAVSDLLLRDLVFHNAARDGLQFTGSLAGHRLEDIEAHDNVQSGISYQANTGEAQSDVLIHGCRTSSNGILGVYKGNGGTRFVVDGCTSSFDSWDPTQGQYTSAIRFISDGTTDRNRVTASAIRNSSVDHSGWDRATGKVSAIGDQEQGSGIWCDTCGNGTEVTGNTITDSAHNGLEIEWTGTTGPVYAINNLITGSRSYGLLLSRRSHGAVIANNTAEDNFVNCAVQGEYGGGETAVGMIGNIFENNICSSQVLNAAGTVAIFRWGGENNARGEGSGNIVRNNDFGDPAATNGSWVLFGAGQKITNLSALEALTGPAHQLGTATPATSAERAGALATPDPTLAQHLPACLLTASGQRIVGACPRPSTPVSP